MRKTDIKIGEVYTDGKGNVREVMDAGSQYVAFPGQVDTDNVQYRIIAKKSGPYRVGDVRCATRASFASWAKAKVVDEPRTTP